MSKKPIKNQFFTEHDDGSITFNGNLIVSETPRTDELAKREFVPDGLWIKLARELERENAALREKARLWEETCYGLSAPHYILDPDLRASKFREALRSYSAITIKTGVTIGAAQPEAQP